MNPIKHILTTLILGMATFGLSLSHVNAGTPKASATSLDSILSATHRSDAHKTRDIYRNPKATLSFFEVEPHMHVAEIWPGAKGWYTEILAPYLSTDGKLYVAHFHPASEVQYFRKSYQKFIEKISENPTIYAKLQVTTLQPPHFLDIAPKGSLDRVLTFRSVHNWMRAGYEQQAFTAFFEALKPGGLLGVVTHRAKANTPKEKMAKSGYVSEQVVIEIAEAAGFELVAKSQINQNTADTADHPEGVWTLPPSLRLDETDREKYLKIGESDRMTLKFKKPDTRQ